jgi:hypothetical protein
VNKDVVLKSNAAYTKSSFKCSIISTVKLDPVMIASMDAETHRRED